MDSHFIPFNRPHLVGGELENIARAHESGVLSGTGPFSSKCERWLETNTKAERALVTHSCTGALEMAALMLDLQPGDEIIMPSYTFVSTANAFVLRGGIPVFVDIKPDTLNIDENLIEAAITPKTRAICVVHYAGVACDMDLILEIANAHNLDVVEDAAQGIMATYKEIPLGTMGRFGCFSFHETKNVICGQGGALLVNSKSDTDVAEIVHQKGTNRSQFSKGKIDKYTWKRAGSSFLLGEMTAAFLMAQLEQAELLTNGRLVSWSFYHENLLSLEERGVLRRPTIPNYCQHNAHMYYILIDEKFDRGDLIAHLKTAGVNAVFHYIPLHSSDAGHKFGRVGSTMTVTNDSSRAILRLPLWTGLTPEQQARVVEALTSFFK